MTEINTSSIHFQEKANEIVIQGLGNRVWKDDQSVLKNKNRKSNGQVHLTFHLMYFQKLILCLGTVCQLSIRDR